MTGGATVWLVLLLGVVAANWPFVSNRLLLLGPLRPDRNFFWRLLELLLLTGVVLALGLALEVRVGQRHPQGWQFYAVVVCLMVTFAFPGFVWRYLRRGQHGA